MMRRITLFTNLQSKHLLQLSILLLLLLFALYSLLPTANLFPGGDNARYLLLAQSLIEGHGYRQVNFVSAPAHTIVPPGFPLLLTFIVGSFGFNVIVAKLYSSLLAALSIATTLAFFRRRHERVRAMLITLLFATSPVVFTYARRVYSDLFFTTLSLLAIVALGKYATSSSRFNWRFALVVALLAASYYVRPAALVLIGVSAFWLSIHDRRLERSILLLFCVLLLITPWFYWLSQVDSRGTVGHFNFFFSISSPAALFNMALENLIGYTVLVAENILYLPTQGLVHAGFTGGLFSIVKWASVVVVLLLIIVGYARSWRRLLDLPLLYVPAYLAVLLIYPFSINRFIIPILPFILAYFAAGLAFTLNRLPQLSFHRERRRVVFKAIVLLLFLSNGVHIAARIYQEQRFHHFAPDAAGVYDVARWTRDNTVEQAIILSDFPQLFYIYAERRLVSSGAEAAVDEVDYVVGSSERDARTRLSVFNGAPEVEMEQVYCSRNGPVCLYQLTHREP